MHESTAHLLCVCVCVVQAAPATGDHWNALPPPAAVGINVLTSYIPWQLMDTYTHACMHTYMCVCVRVCTCACVHASTDVHTYSLPPSLPPSLELAPTTCNRLPRQLGFTPTISRGIEGAMVLIINQTGSANRLQVSCNKVPCGLQSFCCFVDHKELWYNYIHVHTYYISAHNKPVI